MLVHGYLLSNVYLPLLCPLPSSFAESILDEIPAARGGATNSLKLRRTGPILRSGSDSDWTAEDSDSALSMDRGGALEDLVIRLASDNAVSPP